MALSTQITLPKLGESIVSATIVRWLKKPGEYIHLDEPIVEVATDKVNSEIPSPYEGVLETIFAKEGEEVAVGATLASMNSENAPILQQNEVAEKPKCVLQNNKEKNTYLSPAVLRLLKEHNLSIREIEHLSGSGEGGRVTKKDIEQYLHKPHGRHEISQNISEYVIPFSPMRSAIASHMMRSNQEIPAASLVAEVDVTQLLNKIKQAKVHFKKQHGVKLTLTCYFIEALVAACIHYPYMNARYTNEGIAINKHVHLGIAVHVEEGLIVPVLHNADTLPFAKKAAQLEKLKEWSKSKKLEHQHLKGATITLTNFGISGIELGIPIIPYGQTAILGIGSVQKKVVALENGAIAVRDRLSLSLSFDHRVIDGMYGCEFLNAIKHHIESY